MAVRLGWGKNDRLVKFSRTWPWNPCSLKQSASLCRFRVRGAILSTRGVLSSPNFCQDCEVRLPLAPAAGEQASQRRPGIAPGRGRLSPARIGLGVRAGTAPIHREAREACLQVSLDLPSRIPLRFVRPSAINAPHWTRTHELNKPSGTVFSLSYLYFFRRSLSDLFIKLVLLALPRLGYLPLPARLETLAARPIASNSAPALLPAVASRHLASSPPSPCSPLSSSLIGASPAPSSDNLLALSPVDTSTAPSVSSQSTAALASYSYIFLGAVLIPCFSGSAKYKYFVPQHKTRANPAPQTQTTSSYKNSSNKASGRKRKSRKALEESARIQAALGMSKQSVIWHQVKSTPHNLYPNIPWKDGNPTRRPTNSEIQLAYNKVNQFRPLTSGLNIIKEKKEVIAIVEFTPFSELNRSQIDDLNYVSNFLHASKRFINSVSSCSRVWAGLMWAVGWHPSKTIKIL
ncbi:hypothetical protein PCASD_20145 [Puccinia coronata f. sp. avenae]|uniref:Tet-like 2OG-Fe(II) oxygenase domain-containing protein n=1 Tax=Puccinia coronata f. sp. avenae TaxID=200324 RepID=A0A2N5TYX4_9BASI|nr:hypothetical protein PCASD_20145 [Puccinia coronata f. sp. avenae]